MNLSNLLKQQVDESWFHLLKNETKLDYFQKLNEFLNDEFEKNKIIYPEPNLFFNTLSLTSLKKVKVVILGQDPYHGEKQAHGLSFSVLPGVKTPPSLVNIYKELKREFNYPIPNHGYLKSWADQGVLMLNAVLSVEASKAASHQKRGWEIFTDKIISVINEQNEHVVFLLWGSYAHKKGVTIDQEKHLVLEAPHPSPLSAHRGFLGCGHFQKANDYLKSNGKNPIDWQIQNFK